MEGNGPGNDQLKGPGKAPDCLQGEPGTRGPPGPRGRTGPKVSKKMTVIGTD